MKIKKIIIISSLLIPFYCLSQKQSASTSKWIKPRNGGMDYIVHAISPCMDSRKEVENEMNRLIKKQLKNKNDGLNTFYTRFSWVDCIENKIWGGTAAFLLIDDRHNRLKDKNGRQINFEVQAKCNFSTPAKAKLGLYEKVKNIEKNNPGYKAGPISFYIHYCN